MDMIIWVVLIAIVSAVKMIVSPDSVKIVSDVQEGKEILTKVKKEELPIVNNLGLESTPDAYTDILKELGLYI